MEPKRLKDIEAALKEAALPTAPPALEQNVLRQIRQTSSVEVSWSSLVADMLVRAQVALPLLAVAVVMGAVFGAGVISNTVESQPIASKALNFDSLMNLEQSEIIPTR